jgi:trimeric autotransporter adhesin
MRTRARLLAIGVLAILATTLGAPLSAQSDILVQLRSGSPAGDRFLADSAGGIAALGTLGVGSTLTASGPGERMMWMPYFAAFRAGSTRDGGAGTFWDFVNVGFFSWVGGNRNTGKGYASMVMGEDVTVTGNYSTAFGSDTDVTGQYGFAAGDDNHCSSSYCHAVGFTANAAGIAAIALGYRTTADADYSTAIGYRASTNGKTGSFVFSDASSTDSTQAAANYEFLARASGGFRFRTNSTQTTGCNIAAGTGTMTCVSSRALKRNYLDVDGKALLARMRDVPVNSWEYIGEAGAVRHMGPFSEDFARAFGLGADTLGIGHQDIDGVNFAGIRALDARTTSMGETEEILTGAIAALKAENATLVQALHELTERVKTLEAPIRH